MRNSKAISQPASLPAVIKAKIVRPVKADAETALRTLHTVVQKEFCDHLDQFKDRPNAKGLPDSRGARIFQFVQSQIYTAFGLSPQQRKALKGDYKGPLLDLFTRRQLLAIEDTKMEVMELIDKGAAADELRDVTNEKIRAAMARAVSHYGKLFEDKA